MVTRKVVTSAPAKSQRPAATPAVKKAVRKSPAKRGGSTAKTAMPAESKTVPPRPPAPSVNAVAPEPKTKLVRDSFTMPATEYRVLAALKSRLLALGRAAKKGELLRAGVAALASMSDAQLQTAIARIPSLKTGRPKKDKTVGEAGKAAKKRALPKA